MNVGELKRFLDGLDDGVLVVINHQDDYAVAMSARPIELTGGYESAWDYAKKEHVAGKAVYISV